MAYGAHQFNAGQFPLNLLMVEPFLVRDFVKNRAPSYARPTIPELKAEYGRMHIVNVNFTATRSHPLQNAVRTPDDFKGKRVQATHPGMIDVLRSFGSSVVVLPSGAQYENLQKGVVDASSSTLQSVAAFKLAEVSKYHLAWNVASEIACTAMNRESTESLPPDVKAVIDRFSTFEGADAVARSRIVGNDAGVSRSGLRPESFTSCPMQSVRSETAPPAGDREPRGGRGEKESKCAAGLRCHRESAGGVEAGMAGGLSAPKLRFDRKRAGMRHGRLLGQRSRLRSRAAARRAAASPGVCHGSRRRRGVALTRGSNTFIYVVGNTPVEILNNYRCRFCRCSS